VTKDEIALPKKKKKKKNKREAIRNTANKVSRGKDEL